MRSVGMKKTLVYYRGRAPHGARTDWVMHEYRLDERECEVSNGLQDAYALCRVIKRSLNGPKSGDVHYGSDRCSSIEIYSEGRCDMEIRSHEYGMPSSSSSSSMAVHGSPMNIVATPTPSDDNKWNMQYLSNEALSFNNSQLLPNYGTLPYPPSKVNIALECARLQHRFALPPLEIQDFPKVGYVNTKMPQSSFTQSTNQTDIIEEILSVAQSASQCIINQDSSWDGNSCAPVDNFSFLPPNNNQIHDLDSFHFIEQFKEDQNVRPIDIGDFGEDFKSDRMVENLRWIGMSDRDLEKTFLEDYKTVPIENISAVQREENQFQGEYSGHHNSLINATETNNFSIGFGNDNLLDDGDMTDCLSNSPSFEVYEKIEVNHGFFIATRQAAKTFYHQVTPSTTLRIHRNLVTVHDFPIYIGKFSDSTAIMPKERTFLDDFVKKVKRPWTTTMRTLVSMVALLHVIFWICLGECLDEKGSKLKNKRGVSVNRECLMEREEKKNAQDYKWDCYKQNKFPTADKEEEKYCNVAVKKKWP